MKREQHGDRKTRLYTIWTNMKARCNRKSHPQFHNYGGRGIKLMKDWNESYSIFKQWALKNGYSDCLSIDRKDNNKGYSPDNCRWVTSKIQNNNKSNNIVIDNESLTIKCEKLGLNPKLIQARIREQGMTFNEAIKTTHNFRLYKIRYQNKVYNLKELCIELDLNYDTVYKRIKKYGWELSRALENKACEWILEYKKNQCTK